MLRWSGGRLTRTRQAMQCRISERAKLGVMEVASKKRKSWRGNSSDECLRKFPKIIMKGQSRSAGDGCMQGPQEKRMFGQVGRTGCDPHDGARASRTTSSTSAKPSPGSRPTSRSPYRHRPWRPKPWDRWHQAVLATTWARMCPKTDNNTTFLSGRRSVDR